jgi:hypothetical protein
MTVALCFWTSHERSRSAVQRKTLPAKGPSSSQSKLVSQKNTNLHLDQFNAAVPGTGFFSGVIGYRICRTEAFCAEARRCGTMSGQQSHNSLRALLLRLLLRLRLLATFVAVVVASSFCRRLGGLNKVLPL